MQINKSPAGSGAFVAVCAVALFIIKQCADEWLVV